MAAEDKIRFACSHCGHSVAVATAHAGKRGKCPKCGGIIEIPAAAAESPRAEPPVSTPAAAPPQHTCPSCQATLKPAAVICVNCGLDLRTGKKLPGAAAPAVAGAANSTVADVAAAAKLAGTATRGGKPMTIETPPPAVLWCGKCQREYWIDGDSTIFPAEEMLQELKRKGSAVINLSGGSLPDTVREFDFDSLPRDKAAIRRKLNDAILKKAAKDPTRCWACESCSTVHDYSSTRPFDLMIPAADVLDVQEAIFRFLIGVYAPQWPEEPRVLHFSVQDRDPAIGLLERFGYHSGQARGALVLNSTEEHIVLEVRNQKFKTPNLCVAGGTVFGSFARFRVVRQGREWKVFEIDPFVVDHQLVKE